MNKINNRINGIDPGFLKDNGKCITECSEEELFKALYCLNTRMWQYDFDLLDNNIEITSTTTEQDPDLTYNFCIYQTRRFGIVLPSPSLNIDYKDNINYLNWYNNQKKLYPNIEQELIDNYNKKRIYYTKKAYHLYLCSTRKNKEDILTFDQFKEKRDNESIKLGYKNYEEQVKYQMLYNNSNHQKTLKMY
ncbi:MAG: hypothetical protein PHQ89_00690 [Bacilli bacterium]|nr:hypothetical protein [Bacilli bacterium]